MAFNHESTTDDVISGIRLDGKVAVITGASAGLGVETSRVLAGAGARLVMVARDEAKLAAAVETITGAQPDAQIDTLLMDLADLDSVRNAAEQLRQREPKIDLLINNAGVMACPQAQTKPFTPACPRWMCAWRTLPSSPSYDSLYAICSALVSILARKSPCPVVETADTSL